ncbi:MAG TPA: Crp/Fnr family transcriptional regulator [Afifellaceae bacterium]|nr:Crp/Fnr family transcriptional regulator [Afifellaceae bacterium]
MDDLGQIPLLQGLTDGRARTLATQCRWSNWEANELVVDYDDDSSDVYFILSGRVRVLFRTPAGKEVILAELTGGQSFGELAAIDGMRRSANVTALERSRLCVVPGGVFLDLIAGEAAIARRMLAVLAARIRDLNAKLAEHSFLRSRERLYCELLRLSRPRAGHPEQRVITPPPFHHDLASRIGCRREVVSRELSLLAREGLMDKTRGGLVLPNPGEINRRISAGLA